MALHFGFFLDNHSMSIGQQSDIELPSDAPKTLLVSKHIAFIERYAAIPEEDYEYCATEHQRMSAVYWSLTALDLVYALQRSSADEIYPPGTNHNFKCVHYFLLVLVEIYNINTK